MDISPAEAAASLAEIDAIAHKIRRSMATGGMHITLIITGSIWLVGFIATQYLQGTLLASIWIGLNIVGVFLGFALGIQRSKRYHSPSEAPILRRILVFWAILLVFGGLTLLATHPTEGKLATLLIVMFFLIGQMAMGLVISFRYTWWTLIIAVLAITGFFWLPLYFYLWMAILGGGSMIALGIYMRISWQ